MHQLKLLEPLITAWDDPSSKGSFYEAAEFPGSLQDWGIPAEKQQPLH